MPLTSRFGARLLSPVCGIARIAVLAAVAAVPAYATDGPDPDEIADIPSQSVRSFEIYGFAEADAIEDSKRVNPSWVDAFRPSKIGVPDQYGVNPYGSNGDSDVSVKQSRFGVKGFSRLPTATARSTSSSNSTCSESASMRDRRRFACAMPTESGNSCWPGRPTACSCRNIESCILSGYNHA